MEFDIVEMKVQVSFKGSKEKYGRRFFVSLVWLLFPGVYRPGSSFYGLGSAIQNVSKQIWKRMLKREINRLSGC